MIGFSPSLSVEHASASMPLANAESGLVPIVHATGMPSWQSITGDRWALPAGIENSVRSVTHSMFGRSAWKSPSARFAGALVNSPLYEPYRFALLNDGLSPFFVMSLMTRFGRYPDTHAFRLQVDPLVPIAPLAVPERLLDQGQQPRVLVRSVHGLDLVAVCATRDADHAQQASGGHAEPLTGLFDEERLLAAGRVFRVCARLFSQQLQRALPDRDELRPDCWTLFIRIQVQTTVDALRNSSGVCPPSRIWCRLVFQWMM